MKEAELRPVKGKVGEDEGEPADLDIIADDSPSPKGANEAYDDTQDRANDGVLAEIEDDAREANCLADALGGLG